MDYTPYVFLDTETADFEPNNHPWEIALIAQSRYEEDVWGEWVIQISDFDHEVTPQAAAVNGFHERWMRVGDPAWRGRMALSAIAASKMIENICRGKMLVGSNPGFDISALTLLGCRPTWSHRKRDIPSMALGRLGYEAGGLEATAAALEVVRDGQAHTALSDARLTRDCFVEIMKGARRD